MRKIELLVVRSHPVLSAALLGAVVGFAYTLATEFGGLYKRNSNAVLLMIWPNANLGAGMNEATFLQAAFILFIEVGANVLVYALLVSAPVALIVGIRHIFGRRRNRRQ